MKTNLLLERNELTSYNVITLLDSNQ